MSSLQFTEADRDSQGFVAATPPPLPDEPRSLADLLPTPVPAQADALAPITRRQRIIGGVLALLAIFVIFYSFGHAPAAPKPTHAAPTAASAPTTSAAPTVAPTPAPLALLAFFDYRDPASSTPLSSNQIARVVGRAGAGWRQVALTNSDARPWLRTQDIPASVPVANPLPDLAPRPTAIPPAPPYSVAPVADPPIAAPPAIVPTIEEHGRPYYTPIPRIEEHGRSK
jgi:hypothetical protein